VTSDPSSGPGSGVVASKQTAISSAQLKALFTVPVAVSPTPRSDQIVIPVTWAAVAADSDTPYVNGPGGALTLGYPAAGGIQEMSALIAALTAGDPSFVVGILGSTSRIEATAVAGSPLEIYIDTGNLTAGDFPITFTLLYTIIPAS
jgi:hypothetical protein